jgi:threonine-phosphate decarboxylase
LIWLTALAFVRPGDPVLVLGPTYSEYARATQVMGGRALGCRASSANGFVPDVEGIAREMQRLRPLMVFVCNPNNPTGAALPPNVLGEWARRQHEALFVVDEAYLPFVPGLGSALEPTADNVLVLRSMTKDFALAGLRLGFAVGPAPLVELLRRAQPPWSVNTLAQVAGVAALGDLAHRDNSLTRLRQAGLGLATGLARLGLTVVPSVAPFFLVNVGSGAAFRSRLLVRGMLVRDCASFGLPEYVRIAARRPEDNDRLLAAVREVL